MRAVSPPRVLVTGGSGFIGPRVTAPGRRCTVTHAAPKPGEMPAVIVDISAAQALGYAPVHDLKSGLSTVWPEFSEAAK